MPKVFLLLLVLVSSCDRPEAQHPTRVEMVPAPPSGDLSKWVRDEQLRASRDGRFLLVYVSATWCEPCRAFQDAAARGELDAEFGKLRLLKFDFDRDQDRLANAGYASEMIPLFAVPEPSGRGGPRRHAGAIKGADAVDFLRAPLRQLIGDASP